MEEMADINVMYDLLKSGNEASQVEQLLNDFEVHEGKEERYLEDYRKALREVKNPANRFVLQLIVADEEKHRAVNHALVATLKGSLNWSKPEGSLEGDADDAAADAKLLAVTEAFINLEKEGIREYKTLLKDSAGYYHGLFKILVNSMIRDSEKHIELLEFLRQRLTRS
jgi:hypothetical protein